MEASGLEAVLLANRASLLRFLVAHGAGDAAEDVLQELWLRVSAASVGPVAQPLAYLYRAANNLMLDRYRSVRQSVQRDRDWSDAAVTLPGQSDIPSGERTLIARQQLKQAEAVLDDLGERAATVFRRHRLDGMRQSDIAAALGVSISTVESDLRRAYRAMIDLQREFDEA